MAFQTILFPNWICDMCYVLGVGYQLAGNNIIILNSMDIFSLAANYTHNGVRVYTPAQLQSYYTIYNRLKFISPALKNSVQTYKLYCYHEHPLQHIQNSIRTQTAKPNYINEQGQPQYIDIDKQDQQSQDKQADKIRPSNFNNAVVLATNNSKKDVQANRPEIQDVITVKKSNINKIAKQVSRIPAKQKEETAIPQIDLNDSAYLPELGMSQLHLAMLREQLERRRVQQWNEGDKGRRDRRELRMLNT